MRASYQKIRLPETDDYIDKHLREEANVLKCAAVLVPLTFFSGEWHLLFTRRTEMLKQHSGQVSFPGGSCDLADESLEETALREAEEEIGLSREDVTLLGRVNEVMTITHFEVTPIVGLFEFPYGFRVSTIEVERVFTIPLNWLANKRNYWEFQHPVAKHPTIAYHPFDRELLWGATARITQNFLRTIQLLD